MPAETENGDEQKERNLWNTLLRDSAAGSNLKNTKSVLILGQEKCGKDSLVARMKNKSVETIEKGNGLEYCCMDIQTDDDELNPINIWTLDHAQSYNVLLQFAINEKHVQDTMAILTVDLSTPWEALITLNHQVTAIENHLAKLNISVGVLDEMKEKVSNLFEIIEQKEENEISEKQKLIPEKNLGLPLVVVCTKVDRAMELSDLSEEHFDFIQANLREFCFKYGAGLIYTSAILNKNCQLVNECIQKHLFGVPLVSPPNVLDRDSVFVPAGWDSKNKIQVLLDTLKNVSATDLYEDVISAPIHSKNTEQIVEAENEQSFLEKQRIALENKKGNKQQTTTKQHVQDIIGSKKIQEKATSDSSNSSGVTTPVGEENEAIANFFNKLLKTGGPKGSSPKQDKKR